MNPRTIALLTMGLVAAPLPAAAQTGLEPVRARYAAADYEGALAALADMPSGASADARLAAERLRALSLLALGHTEEADAAIARIVTAQPSFDPGDDVSPRIRLAFRSVRDRLVPVHARRLYDEGRFAFDRGAYAEAIDRFGQALPALEAMALTGRRDMEDMRVLANGFMALARERVPPLPLPAPEPLVAHAWAFETVTAVNPPAEFSSAPSAPSASSALMMADAPPTQPVAIRQDLPSWTPALGGAEGVFRGVVEVRIDESGQVVEAVLSTPVHPQYDPHLLRAAREWRYEPALRAGTPVASHKRVEVVLRSR